ncbi:MAG: hemerythrin domain-containing protein [Terriglobia bacterium]
MKRHPSLHPLSEHHHHVLVQALGIRRAQETTGAQRQRSLREAAEAFIRFYKGQGRVHFREEEEILLPAYARCMPLERDLQVTRMLAEHAIIRAKVEDLEKALAAGRLEEAEVLALGKLLQGHVRLEEDNIFPRIESVLGEEGLRALAERFTWLHREKKGDAEP